MTPTSTLLGWGLAVADRRGIHWTEKGWAIAKATHAERAATLVREAAAMNLEMEDDLEEAGRW